MSWSNVGVTKAPLLSSHVMLQRLLGLINIWSHTRYILTLRLFCRAGICSHSWCSLQTASPVWSSYVARAHPDLFWLKCYNECFVAFVEVVFELHWWPRQPMLKKWYVKEAILAKFLNKDVSFSDLIGLYGKFFPMPDAWWVKWERDNLYFVLHTIWLVD